jgi:hypothetical protein
MNERLKSFDDKIDIRTKLSDSVVGPIAIIDTIRYNEEVQFGNISTLETR